MSAAGRGARRRQDGRGAAVRACCAAAPRRPTSSSPRAAPERAATLARAVRRRACSATRRPRAAADTLILTVKPQDMGALLDELGAARARPTGWSSRRRPASRPRSSSAGSPTGTPVVRVMSNTPVLVDEAMSAISAGAHAAEEHLARTEAIFAPGRPDDPGARVAAGRGDRAVRQRPGVLLLPGRGDDRRRHPARPAPRRWRTTSSCRPRSARR